MRRRVWQVATALGLLLLLSTVVGCRLLPSAGGIPPAPASPTPVSGSLANWYEIYFTDPTCPPEEQRRNGVDDIIALDLLEAQDRVDVAAFDLDALPIVDALIALDRRGVPVRVVTDSDNADLESIQRLRAGEVDVVTDERSALMHNKFIILDDEAVWTGSMNLTSNGAYCNNNSMVRFAVPQLIANYTTEFEEMYLEASFGPRSEAATPYRQFLFQGVALENYFAPEEEVAPVIATRIAEAEESIHFMAFSFTNETIGEAMFERAEAGVNVRGVFERTGSQTSFSYYPDFAEAGLANLTVRQDGNPRIMHHKVIILDGETVIFGSFNFTGSANDENDENVIIVRDPTFAGFFEEEFETVWTEAGEGD